MSIKMQFSRPLHRLTCAIAAALCAPSLACAAEMTTTTLDSVNVQATQAAAMAQVKRWRGRENCILMLT
ncbi:hypothetical protein DB763_20035 [Xanthomonas perforans]|nr:hypothetical protein DB763_20035 [Xanthomonas perforans]